MKPHSQTHTHARTLTHTHTRTPTHTPSSSSSFKSCCEMSVWVSGRVSWRVMKGPVVILTLQSMRHSRPSCTMRSPGACRKWGRKWRSWMFSFSSPLSLDRDRGLRERERERERRRERRRERERRRHGERENGLSYWRWNSGPPSDSLPLPVMRLDSNWP